MSVWILRQQFRCRLQDLQIQVQSAPIKPNHTVYFSYLELFEKCFFVYPTQRRVCHYPGVLHGVVCSQSNGGYLCSTNAALFLISRKSLCWINTKVRRVPLQAWKMCQNLPASCGEMSEYQWATEYKCQTIWIYCRGGVKLFKLPSHCIQLSTRDTIIKNKKYCLKVWNQ